MLATTMMTNYDVDQPRWWPLLRRWRRWPPPPLRRGPPPTRWGTPGQLTTTRTTAPQQLLPFLPPRFRYFFLPISRHCPFKRANVTSAIPLPVQQLGDVPRGCSLTCRSTSWRFSRIPIYDLPIKHNFTYLQYFLNCHCCHLKHPGIPNILRCSLSINAHYP